MKPSEKYIKYLQAHPAVWEALQKEWEPSVGDWVWCTVYHNMMHSLVEDHDKYEAVLVTGVGCDGAQTTKAYRYRDELVWLPTLGQLVRMLQEAITQKDWETVPYLDVRWAEITLHFPSQEVAACVLGECADGETLIAFIGNELLDTGCQEEPEIACTALWAKVKGVE